MPAGTLTVTLETGSAASASGPAAMDVTAGVGVRAGVMVGRKVRVGVGVRVGVTVAVGVGKGGGPLCNTSRTAWAVITGIVPERLAVAA